MAATSSALGLVFALSLREAAFPQSWNSPSSILLLLDIASLMAGAWGSVLYSDETSISGRHCDLMPLEYKLL